MRKYFFPYIATIIILIVIVACNSHTEPANAKPRIPEEKKFGSIKLKYEDTTQPEFRRMVRRLDSFYAIQTRTGFNGSVLVGYKGKVLYERYYGLANRETGLKLNPNSAVQLASVSKTFTAAAILWLHQQKYLNIDEKLQTYLPQMPYPDVTVRMLLCHRSGIPDYIKWVPSFRKDTKTPMTNADVIAMFAKHRPAMEFRANSRFKYCNSNYAILASIIEEMIGMSYEDFMRKYIFDPLGMKNTFAYNAFKGLPYGNTISYKASWLKEPDMFADGVLGDKGIYSTVEDMYRWDQSFYKNTFLNNETIEMAYGPCSFEKPGIKNYGLGWRMLCYPDGDKIIYHNGWWHGNNTVFYRFIQDNFTIIILGNKYNQGIYRQAPVVYSILKNTDADKGFDTEG